MSRSAESPGAGLLRLWDRLARYPGGGRLFMHLLGRSVPYTATMGARVVEFEPGHARVELRDRPKVRNHLGSVHAIALANLGELATGLAVLSCMPPSVRGILTRLEIQYVKKARGLLTAEVRAHMDAVVEPTERTVEAPIVDATGDVVAVARATWRLSPGPGS